MKKTSRTITLARLAARGFDQCRPSGLGSAVHVGCSQCAALVVNGTAVHETGCPHITYECKGCNATVARQGAYCEDCR